MTKVRHTSDKRQISTDFSYFLVLSYVFLNTENIGKKQTSLSADDES
jgi:hypothetical protein